MSTGTREFLYTGIGNTPLSRMLMKELDEKERRNSAAVVIQMVYRARKTNVNHRKSTVNHRKSTVNYQKYSVFVRVSGDM
jgi:hypothetical protein